MVPEIEEIARDENAEIVERIIARQALIQGDLELLDPSPAVEDLLDSIRAGQAAIDELIKQIIEKQDDEG